MPKRIRSRKLVPKADLKVLVFASALWLTAIQVVFYLIQVNQAENVTKSIQTQLRQELDFSNFHYLARSLVDANSLKNISCPKLILHAQDGDVTVLDLTTHSTCQSRSWLLDGVPVSEKLQSLNGDTYTLEFASVNQPIFFIALWLARLIGLLQIIAVYWFEKTRRAKDLAILEIEKMQNEKLVLLASQVSHDIRSPLSALNMAIGSLDGLPEEKRLLIRSATQRINDIANGLLRQGKEQASERKSTVENGKPFSDPSDLVMLVPLLETVISEKRLQFREKIDIEIRGDLNHAYGLFAQINSTELSRALSNLVNNSVEAISDKGCVTLAVRGYQNQSLIIVQDNGKGIPPEVLTRLGQRGVSYGKGGTESESGSGLGIYHARELIENSGGKFSIQSQVGLGTQITLALPRTKSPSWFPEELSLTRDMIVVSVDDDQSIHHIWSKRLSDTLSSGMNVKHVPLASLTQLEAWVTSHDTQSCLFLVDYEFVGQETNGLDSIERLGLAPQAVVVTSRFDEPIVRTRSATLGVRILPKSLAPFIPIELLSD